MVEPNGLWVFALSWRCAYQDASWWAKRLQL